MACTTVHSIASIRAMENALNADRLPEIRRLLYKAREFVEQFR